MVSSKITKKASSKNKSSKGKSKSKKQQIKSGTGANSFQNKSISKDKFLVKSSKNLSLSKRKIENISSSKKSVPKCSKSNLNRKSSSNTKTNKNKVREKSQTKTKPIEKTSQSKSKITSNKAVKLFNDMRNDSKCNSMLKKFLTQELFDKLMKKKTKMGSTLIDCIQTGLVNHDSHIGIYAADPDAYNTFADLFNPIIQEYHGFKPTDSQPAVDYGDLDKFVDLDPNKEFIISTRVRCGRSLKGIPFNPCMKEQHYKELEKKISGLLKGIPDKELEGEYLSLQGMNKQEQKKLIDEHFLFKEGDKFLQAGNACRYWPVGRGIFLNKNKTFMVWIGEEDHVRIISMQDGANLKDIFGRMINGVKYLESKCEFVHDKRLGYLTFCPTNLGTTIRASVMIKLPKITSNKESFESTANKLNLQVRGASGEHTDSPDGLYDVSNKRRLGLTEFEAVMEMQKGVLKLIEMEKNQKLE